MKQIYLYILFLCININVLYATDNTISCETCSHITQQLQKLTTILPSYRKQLLKNIDNPSPPFFYQNLTQITSSVNHLNKSLNQLTLRSPLYLTDSNECFFQRLISPITNIIATFEPPSLTPPSPSESSNASKLSLCCSAIPSLLLTLSPSIDFRIELTKKCNKIYDKNSVKNNKTLSIIKLLNDYLTLYQMNSNLYQHAANVFQEIDEKNISNNKLYSICASCSLSNIHKSCITLYQQYNHIIKILKDTIQYSTNILSPILTEGMTQIPLKAQTGEKIAVIPDSPSQTVFIVKNENIYFPTFINIWDPKIGIEVMKPSLSLVETETRINQQNKIESWIISPEQFQGKAAPQCIYISLDELQLRIQKKTDESNKTIEQISNTLSTSSWK